MISVDILTTFIGWCLVINAGVLVFSTIILVLMKGQISSIHSKLFGVNQEDLSSIYFQYLGNYKLVIIVFNLVPYIALKVI